jgi:hypothetical protein
MKALYVVIYAADVHAGRGASSTAVPGWVATSGGAVSVTFNPLTAESSSSSSQSPRACFPTALYYPYPCAGMLGSPESPGYLAAKGKRDEAVAVATKLWGAKGVAQLGESAGGWAVCFGTCTGTL